MKNRGSIIRAFLSVFSIALAVIVATTLCCGVPRHDSEIKMNSFYNEKEDTLDYVVLGASAVRCGVFPVVIYNEYGITGNVYALGAIKSEVFPLLLEEVHSKQKDALFIVDFDGFSEEPSDRRDPKRIFIDSLPYGDKTWRKSIKELDAEYWLEHVAPIVRYHNNITKFKALLPQGIEQFNSDIKNNTDCMKGAQLGQDYDHLDEEQLKAFSIFRDLNNTKAQLDDNTFNNLKLFLDNCKNLDVKDVIFVNMPKAYYDDESYLRVSNQAKRVQSCKELIRKYGYEYIDFCENELVLANDDFEDTTHLNKYGATKISKYLGEYILKNYELSEKEQSVNSEWEVLTEKAYETFKL